jgi:hypothetical protein
MKTILLSIIMLIISLSIFSQDIISLKNGKRIEALVTEVTPTVVRYKLFKEPKGSVRFIYIDDISGILYQNGKIEIFESSEEQK